MWVSYKAWELRRCLILKVYQKWAWLDSDHSKLPWITARLKMRWCNFFLQNSDYKSHIYKDPWHPACRKNTSTAIRLIIPRNPFISHPSTGSFPSRNKIMHPPLKKCTNIFHTDRKSGVGGGARSTTDLKSMGPWHIKIKLLTEETQRKYILNSIPRIPWGF